MPAFLFLHAGSLVHYRPPFSRDPAPRVAFLLKKVSTVPESAEHEVLWASCQRCGDTGPAAGLGDRRDRHAASDLGKAGAFSWRSDGTEERSILQYSITRTAESEESWRRRAFYHLHTTGEKELRRQNRQGSQHD